MLQGTVGLIGTYLSPTGAFTLRSTGRLGGVKGPGRRLSQSSRLFIDMGNKDAMTDGTLKASVTKVRLVHASVRQLHKKSGEWDYPKWGEPVSQKYTTGAACVFSTQILQAMKNLGMQVSRDDAHGFICAWHYINHYLGTPQKWLLPKNADEVERLWNAERDKEWKKTEDGVYMTKQAVDFYKQFFPDPITHEAFIAMIRHAMTDKYADMAGLPSNPVLDPAAKTAAAGDSLISGVGGGLGGTTKKTVGVNPYEKILGEASKAFNAVERYALTHDQDDQPQMHQQLGDDR